MLDWLPHHERGPNSQPVLGSRGRSAPLSLARVTAAGFPAPMAPLSYSLVVRPFLETFFSGPGPIFRPWYGYLYLASEPNDLPPSIIPEVSPAVLSRLTTQQLLDRARHLASQPVIARESLAAACESLACLEGGEALTECRRTLDEIALRMCEGGVLDSINSLYLLNDDELDDYVMDPQIYVDAIRARSEKFADVADREPPEILDGRTLAYGSWPRRGGIHVGHR